MHRHERLDAPRDAEHVDVEAPAPVVLFVLPQHRLAAGADARVVADHVHRAVDALRLDARRSTDSSFVTSVTHPATVRVRRRAARRPLRRAAPGWMSASITCMPCSAKWRPIASPMPLAPPVTTATLPSTSRMVVQCNEASFISRSVAWNRSRSAGSGSALDGPGGGYDKIHRLAFDEAAEQGLLDRPVEFVLHAENGLPQRLGEERDRRLPVPRRRGLHRRRRRVQLRQRDHRRAARQRAAGAADQLVRHRAPAGRLLLPARQRRLRRRRRARRRVAEAQRATQRVAVLSEISPNGEEYFRFFRQECRRRGVSIAAVETVSQSPENLATNLDNLRQVERRRARVHGLRDARGEGAAARGARRARRGTRRASWAPRSCSI